MATHLLPNKHPRRTTRRWMAIAPHKTHHKLTHSPHCAACATCHLRRAASHLGPGGMIALRARVRWLLTGLPRLRRRPRLPRLRPFSIYSERPHDINTRELLSAAPTSAVGLEVGTAVAREGHPPKHLHVRRLLILRRHSATPATPRRLSGSLRSGQRGEARNAPSLRQKFAKLKDTQKSLRS